MDYMIESLNNIKFAIESAKDEWDKLIVFVELDEGVKLTFEESFNQLSTEVNKWVDKSKLEIEGERKLIRIIAEAESINSRKIAIGNAYIPYTVYEENKELLKEAQVVAYDLDEDESEIVADIYFEEIKEKEIEQKTNKLDEALRESLYLLLDLSYQQYARLEKFNKDLISR